MGWAKAIAWWDENHLSFDLSASYIRDFTILLNFLQQYVLTSYSKVVSIMVDPASEVLTAAVLYNLVTK